MEYKKRRKDATILAVKSHTS